MDLVTQFSKLTRQSITARIEHDRLPYNDRVATESACVCFINLDQILDTLLDRTLRIQIRRLVDNRSLAPRERTKHVSR